MKVYVKSVSSIKSDTPMDPLTLARLAQKVVGKTVELNMESTQTIAELNNLALAAFAFPDVRIVKVVCEPGAPVADDITLAMAGIRDGDNVLCRFTIDAN
jgi:hypothetical protein